MMSQHTQINIVFLVCKQVMNAVVVTCMLYQISQPINQDIFINTQNQFTVVNRVNVFLLVYTFINPASDEHSGGDVHTLSNQSANKSGYFHKYTKSIYCRQYS